jgi:tetrapyrrole methylase family protein/MazG family protein
LLDEDFFMGITVIGLGPGDSQMITRQVWEILLEADTVYLRTERHPAVADLPNRAKYISFDRFYESSANFNTVYEQIVNELISLARTVVQNGKHIVYAVPGHPMVGESTVSALLSAARDQGLTVKIVPGLSFIEPVLTALGLDALDGFQLFDAIEVAQYNHPPLISERPLLLGQVFNRMLAGELKLALMNLYPDEHEVMLVHNAGMASQRIENLPLYSIDHNDNFTHLTCLFVPALPYTSTLQSFAETIAILRGPDGCPWDQEQTHQSLRNGFLEEASEVLAALDEEDPEALCEELGDVLYHLVMQAQIASEYGEFKLADVIIGIDNKLKHRHPHVWGDLDVEDSQEVIRNWELIKDREKNDDPKKASILDNVPTSLPALARAQKIQERVKRVGFDWPSLSGVEGKVQEEISELRMAGSHQERQYELGDLLFAIVNWARWLNIDAETGLREAVIRFSRRFRYVEQLADERGLDLIDLDINALEKLWDEAKKLA